MSELYLLPCRCSNATEVLVYILIFSQYNLWNGGLVTGVESDSLIE